MSGSYAEILQLFVRSTLTKIDNERLLLMQMTLVLS